MANLITLFAKKKPTKKPAKVIMGKMTLTEGMPTNLLTHQAIQQGDGGLCQIGVGNYYGARYIPFVKNGINWVATDFQDVFSYNFSGCIMAAFNYQRINRVCHVSTGLGQDCKDEWYRIKRNSFNVFAFKPSDYIETKGKALVGCYGLITTDYRLYSITVVHDNGRRIVSSIKQCRMLV